MKHVWILNHYAQEPGGAGGTRHYYLAKHLEKHGWTATVIAASVELNTGRQRLQAGEKWRVDRFGGIPFLWIRTPQYQGNKGGRMANMLIYSLRILLPSITRNLPRPDALIGSSVHPFAAWAAALLAKRHKVPFVFEVRDLWPQTLIDMKRLRAGSMTARLMQRLEKWLYDHSDRIVTLLPGAGDYIEPLGVPARKIIWIPNGVDMSDFPVPAPAQPRDQFTLMYFGAHGQANGLDNVLHGMHELDRHKVAMPVRLRLIGDGPLKPALMSLSRELGLNNVSFEDPVPKKRIPFLASEADAFVFNLINAPVFKYGISSNKLFDFMAAARPVLFCCDASNNPVAEAGAGLTIAPGNPGALADGIDALIDLPMEQRIAMGHAARAYIEKNHCFEHLAARLAETLDVCVVERA